MNTINVITSDRKLLNYANGLWALHFGHKEMNGEQYECLEITYRVKPSFSLVNKHIQQAGYPPVTQEQYDKNEV